MAKELVLEEYEDYDSYDDYETDEYDNYIDSEIDYFDDSNYEDSDYFANEYNDDYEELEEKRFNPGSFLSVIALLSTWFIRLGVAMGIVLLVTLFVMGRISTVFLFILGLIVAFFFGYGFMFCLDHFVMKENN